MRSSISAFWNTTLPRIASATTVSPANGALKRMVNGAAGAGGALRVAAAPVVHRLAAGGLRGLALLLELLGAAIAAIGVPCGEQALGVVAIELAALALEERSLVPVQAEPAQALEDRVHRRGGGALLVGVLDAQHEDAAAVAREEIVEQRRPRAADVQEAARARREARADGRHRRASTSAPVGSQRTTGELRKRLALLRGF